MNTVSKTIRTLVELALLVALILLIIFAIRWMIAGEPASAPPPSYQAPQTTEQEEKITELPYVAPNESLGLPTPVVVIYGTPRPTITPLPPGAYPGPVFGPTFTPYPSPTLRPGPTDTPLPLVEPAQDASGVIQYVAKQGEDTVSLVSLPVDAFGLANGPPEQVTLYNLWC